MLEYLPLFSVSATKYIQEVCRPFHHLALTNFMHDITFRDGEISMLVSDEKVFLHYYQNKIPTLCTDQSGRTLAAGIYLNKTLEDMRQDCTVLMPLLVKVGRQHGQNYGQHSVHIVEREDDCQHLYSLFFDLNENDFLQWILNNGHFLNDFIHQYNMVAKNIILEAKNKENRIVLPHFSDLTNAIKVDNVSESTSLKLIHKNLNSPVYFSKQQSKCLRLLVKGKSAKEIAAAMKISHRTVEHYLEKIRKQLGCSSTREIMAFYGEQLFDNYQYS